MYILKGCARCQGDLCPDEDGGLACLQCGRSTSRGAYQQHTMRTGTLPSQSLSAALAPAARSLGTSHYAA